MNRESLRAMLERFETTKADDQTFYKFRFGTSDKLVQLTQHQLDRMPYLSTLVAHKDDFLSMKNDQNEYVLRHPIHYNEFMAILHSITIEQPYALFTSLPEDDNILDVLQLIDYLGINSFSCPLLKEPNIVLSNPPHREKDKKHIEYHRVKNISEARNTAAAFVLALTRNEYNLHHFKTNECIVSLISIIFSNRDVFSSRFRHHTYTIAKEYVFPLFLRKHPIHMFPTIKQSDSMDSGIYLMNDTQPLPKHFKNAFAWKGKYTLVINILIFGPKCVGKSAILNCLLGRMENNVSATSFALPVIEPNPEILFTLVDTPGVFENTVQARTISLLADPVVTVQYMNEAESARSGRFNTLLKRPKVDRFKHRCGPKVQQYR